LSLHDALPILARALLSDKNIILLDEPTAHLDIETEYEVKQLILQLFQDKFVLIATHRMHWLTDMDGVYKVNHGFINEQTESKVNEVYHHGSEGGKQHA